MQLFPAIDLRSGKVVRLTQGDYDRMTVYGEDPCAQARQFRPLRRSPASSPLGRAKA